MIDLWKSFPLEQRFMKREITNLEKKQKSGKKFENAKNRDSGHCVQWPASELDENPVLLFFYYFPHMEFTVHTPGRLG